jgi:peptide/nickel transport system substrate-binding protein
LAVADRVLGRGGFARRGARRREHERRREARKGGTLRLSRYADVDYVDPALAYAPYSWPILFATCAKLFNHPDRPGAAGTRVIPEVVNGFTISRDGRTYSFELRRTFRFHTGAPVTARSFADAFNRVANPRMGSPATGWMHEIVGADAVSAAKARTISGVRVLGRYRLQIRLTRPLGDFTARLTMPFFCPILPNTPIDPDGIDKPAGSGPYYVAERVANRRIVLKRNPFYHGGRPANVDQVVWTIGESREECLLATEQDRIDHCVGAESLPPAAYRPLAEKYGINRPDGQFFVAPRLQTWYLAFNHDRPAFKGRGQIPLKKAINYAIDRPALAPTFGHLGARRTDQILPPALGRNASIYPIRGADPATAREWLARARFKPAKLVLYANNNPNLGGVAAAQVIAFNLKQIDIDVELKYFAWPGALIQGRYAGRAVRPRFRRLDARLCRRGRLVRAAAPRRDPQPDRERQLCVSRRPGGQCADRRGQSAHRHCPAQSLGGPRSRSDARRPALGAVHARDASRFRLTELRLLLLPPRLSPRHRGRV